MMQQFFRSINRSCHPGTIRSLTCSYFGNAAASTNLRTIHVFKLTQVIEASRGVQQVGRNSREAFGVQYRFCLNRQLHLQKSIRNIRKHFSEEQKSFTNHDYYYVTVMYHINHPTFSMLTVEHYALRPVESPNSMTSKVSDT